MTGLQETADALSTYAADQRRLKELEAGYDDARHAVVLTRAQYAGGLQDLQASLRAQANALTLEDQLVQTRAATAVDLVTLYRALGGGWAPGAGADLLSPAARGLDGHVAAVGELSALSPTLSGFNGVASTIDNESPTMRRFGRWR